MPARVYLVGAGPGDPELLTLKALRILRAADVVLHDDLVSAEVLALAPRSARLLAVGKRCGKAPIPQSEINSLLVMYARQGRTVVRLKGGDPLIFGRAGEEMEALRDQGIDFEVVPGVTAAFAAAASAGIPLTHRRLASGLIFLSGHLSKQNSYNWRAIVASGATIVLYMPGQRCSAIAAELRRAGLQSDTPCLIVSRATAQDEQVHKTILADLKDAPAIPAPALLVIGPVASFGRDVSDYINEQAMVAGAPADGEAVPVFTIWPQHADQA